MATYSAQCSAVGGFSYANRFNLYVELSDTNSNSSTNTSTVNYNVYFSNTTGGGTFSSRTRLYFIINGTVIRDETLTVDGPRNGSVSIASGSITVGHNDDGTKAISFQALVQSASYGISGNISNTFTLNTIPRKSSVSGGSGNIGLSTTISIVRASNSFTHTLRYAFGSLSGTIATGVGTSYNWTIPTSFYAQIPNSKTGTGAIYCDTYSGSTLIGTKTTSFTATATESSSRPTTSATLIDTNSTTKTLTGDANKLVRGKSTAQLTITSSVKNSASIKSVTVNGTNVGTSATITKTYSNVSTPKFTIVTTDSRGYTNTTLEKTPSYVNYVPLTLSINITRPQPTGTEIQMIYSGNYFNASFGAVTNTLSMSWNYRVKGATSWTTGGTITPTLSGNTISNKTVSLGTNYNYQTAYEFQIIAKDKLTTVTQTIQVSVGMPVFYWGKNFFRHTVNPELSKTSGNTGDAAYYARRTDTGTGVWMGVGSGGINHGVYSEKLNKWIVHANGSNVYFNGRMDDLSTKNTTDTWVPVLANGKIQHREISAQINNALPTSLFDNSSGTTGTVTLNETSANFSYIEIISTSAGEYYSSGKIPAPNNKNVALSSIHWDSTGYYLFSKKIAISGTSITVAHSKSHFTTGNDGSIGDYNYNKIVKVIGYR